ncbi:MAG: Holliday junction resolvase RuvX [Candidatus Omnitrophica bacterium]|nr:Holliday junction resolvase RuvX [Candidatus Omnitrophota bacterium]
MRTLALDLGKKRIGLAISDALGITAQPLEVLTRTDRAGDLDHLKAIIRNMNVTRVVVGLPLNMDGTAGEKADEAYEFVELLNGELNIPIKLWDERLTTMEASRILLQADVSRKKRKKVDDKMAAQLILQSYLSANDTKT